MKNYIIVLLCSLLASVVFASTDNQVPKVIKTMTPNEEYVLGNNYLKGNNNIPKDSSKAAKWILKAAIDGDVNAMLEVSAVFLETHHYEEAFHFLTLCSNKGNADCKFLLGTLYLYGNGVPKDYNKADQLFYDAIKGGNFAALEQLGEMYETGTGETKDLQKAFQFYQLSADNGDDVGQFKMGYFYANGITVPVDYEKAKLWWSLSANNGNAKAQYDLGYLYQNGLVDNEVNLQMALKFYRLASDQFESHALNNLAAMYEFGKGTIKSNVIATALFYVSVLSDTSNENTKALTNFKQASSELSPYETTISKKLALNILKNKNVTKEIMKYEKENSI